MNYAKKLSEKLMFTSKRTRHTIHTLLLAAFLLLSNYESFGQAHCDEFFHPFIPQTIDPVRTIRVRFVMFTDGSGQSIWSGTGTASCVYACFVANSQYFSNIPLPGIAVQGVSHIADSKIRLEFDRLDIIQDPSCYSNVSNAYPTHIDPNCINVFLGYGGPMFFTSPDPAAANRPGQYIGFISTQTSYVHDYGQVLAHEVGHMLGLEHAYVPHGWSGETFACGTSSFNVEVNDYARTTYTNMVPCGTGNSNNLMNLDAGCNEYLSPGQMAVMHYYMCTRFASCLTSTAYPYSTEVDHSEDYTVTQNETWNDPHYMKGDLYVQAPNTLSINCVPVLMTHAAKIIVEKGAQLVINGGTVTCASGRTWYGIEVHGDPTQSHTTADPNNPGCVLNQGALRLKNGATISHADYGIRDHEGVYSNPTGLIFAQDAKFIDNQYDVMFSDPPSPYVNVSYFSNCTFTVSGTIGDGRTPVARIYLSGARGVKIRGCTLGITTGNYNGNEGWGIWSSDSEFLVQANGTTPTVIKNFKRGFQVANSNPLAIPTISGTHLINNSNMGAYFENVHTMIFHENIIQNPSYPGIGVYLDRCRHYKIRGNTFKESSTMRLSTGLDVFRSNDGGHEVYKNHFSALAMGVNVFDNNNSPPGTTNFMASSSGLKINCNNYQPETGFAPNKFDIALTYTPALAMATINRVQGNTDQSAASGNLVRNIYNAQNCTDGNMFHAHTGNTMTIEHGSNTNSVTAITQPTGACRSSQINVVNKNIPLDYPVDCPGSTASSGGNFTSISNQLSNLNEYATSLRIAAAEEEADIDYELQSTIATKLNCFLTDTNGLEIDSVLAIYDQNQGGHSDPQIMAIYACLLAGDFDAANARVASLNSGYEGWSDFFDLLIDQLQAEHGLAGLAADSSAQNLLITMAETDNGQAQAAALALLQTYTDYSYTPPHPEPEGGLGERKRRAAAENEQEFTKHISEVPIIVYPNPNDGRLNIDYIYDTGAGAAAELRDPLGRLLMTIQLNSGQNSLSIQEFSNGVYFLNIKDAAGKTVHRANVIKE